MENVIKKNDNGHSNLKCCYCGSQKFVFIEKRTYNQYICSNCGKYFQDTLSNVRKPTKKK
jgi:transcription elongation factor Elf1